MTFWERQEAWNKALALMAKHYADLDMEIVVVADGCACEQQVETPWPVRIYHLPEKDAAMDPCVPLNVAVAMARGDVLVWQNPEILHEQPVLHEMLSELERIGPKGFVLAAAWCPEQEMWHTHSTRFSLADGWKMPQGSGFSFCGMLYKRFWYDIGGNDDIYRHGAGYSDTDFNKRAEKAGAVFKIRDDLVVTHPKTGARTNWPAGGFDRNQAIFNAKWQPMANVVCVNQGNYLGRGAEYVNRLYRGVRNNLREGYKARFICFTDTPEGIDPGVECRDMPSTLKGWWAKLDLFRPGLFPDGERVVFFDLDAVIVRDIDAILDYAGPFACLRDSYRLDGFSSGVMLWPSGWGAHIIEEFEKQGRPIEEFTGGDQQWIERVEPNALRLQDIFKGAFRSYKVDCHDGLPDDAKVVSFHGTPRPHEVDDEWMRLIWQDGRTLSDAISVVCNTSDGPLRRNIVDACARPHPWLERLPAHGEHVAIVGGGPSVKDNLEDIRARKAAGQTIASLNGAYHYLVRHGIEPDWQIVMDPRAEEENVRFVRGVHAKRLFLSSQCDPSLFEAVNGSAVTVFHNATHIAVDSIEPQGRPMHLIGGGSYVGLAAMALAYCEGYRNFHLYGYDSSYSDGQHHAYEQKLNDGQNVLDVHVAGRDFKCASWMVSQVEQFQDTARTLANAGCLITVHGDGMLPHVAKTMMGG